MTTLKKGAVVLATQNERGDKFSVPEAATVVEDYGGPSVAVKLLNGQIHAVPRASLIIEKKSKAKAPSTRPAKGTPTDTNIFALSELVLKNAGRSTFSNRLDSVDYPHIKRTLAGGLVEASSPTTLTLTPTGRDVVLRRLRKDYSSKSDFLARAPDRFDARDRARLEQLRTAIANLEADR